MDIHPWTKYEIAQSRREERILRGLAAYHALRGEDGGAVDLEAESRSARTSLLDRLHRRKLGASRAPAQSAR